MRSDPCATEFAFEIGSGLLSEVRRLQALLAERDKVIQDMKEERDDIEKTVESLRLASQGTTRRQPRPHLRSPRSSGGPLTEVSDGGLSAQDCTADTTAGENDNRNETRSRSNATAMRL